jgi:hypothetical protein
MQRTWTWLLSKARLSLPYPRQGGRAAAKRAGVELFKFVKP